MMKLKKIVGLIGPKSMSQLSGVVAVSLVLGISAANGQALRHDSEALSRVRRGTESDSEYLSRLLNQSMSFVRSDHSTCLHSAGVDGSNLEHAKDKKRQNEQICALIEPLNSESRFNFDESESNVCTPFWKDGKPPWVRNPALMDVINSYNTKNFVPPSRQQMLKQGKTIMTEEQKQSLFRKVEAIGEKAAGFCCDSLGPQQQECRQAIRDVKIEICRDEASDKDPSRPDSCATVNAAFNRSGPENVQILKQMMRDGAKARRIKSSTLEEFNKKFGSYLESGEIKALNVVPSDKVITGRIILSPYFSNGSSVSVPSTIGHEFMHACSLIRKQLDVKHDSMFSDASMQVTIDDHKNSCEVSGATVESYGGMLSHFKVDGPGVSGCLTKLALKTTERSSSVYVKNSCYRRKVEEGMADVAGMFLVDPAIPDGFPGRACEFLPSVNHPHPAEVAKCMIANLPSYKKLVQEAFQCPVSPQQ